MLLPVPESPVTTRAPAGGVGAAVQYHQSTARLDDLIDGRCRDHDQPCMVGDALLVIGVAFGGGQRLELLYRKQIDP